MTQLMQKSNITLDEFKSGMRQMAAGVNVITVNDNGHRDGMILHSATRTLRLPPGVLRLRPTNLGIPSVMTAMTETISPFVKPSRASYRPPRART